jgi:hypothetical protein
MSLQILVSSSELARQVARSSDHPDPADAALVAKLMLAYSKCISHTFSKLESTEGATVAICSLPFIGDFIRQKKQELPD